MRRGSGKKPFWGYDSGPRGEGARCLGRGHRVRFPILPLVGAVFLGISAVFLVTACRVDSNHRESGAIARKIRLRIALIFAAVGVGLLLLNSVVAR